MNYTLPLEMLYRWEKERADEIYLSQPIDGKIHEWSWKETSKQVRKMASYSKDNLPENSKINVTVCSQTTGFPQPPRAPRHR